MPGKVRRPARKACTASSLAALNAAGTVPPARPAANARSRAGKASRSTGSNVHAAGRLKSQAAETGSSRSGHASASAMGSRMSGGLAWAIVAPSVKVTIECTTDCGWTTTSMRSYGTPKSRCASMTSRPLLTSVAELMVTTGPMSQVGCARACAAVTDAICAAVRPRKGPPEAVSTRALTSRSAPERRHWARALCSESTGTICPGRAAPVTSRPPAISDSLLASASMRPARSAANVGSRPTDPVIPLSTTSASTLCTISTAADVPTATAASGCARCCAASSSARAPPAPMPTTSKRSGCARITSSACVPMDPVEPSTITRRRLAVSRAVVTTAIVPHRTYPLMVLTNTGWVGVPVDEAQAV